jgi:hypothetical protein
MTELDLSSSVGRGEETMRRNHFAAWRIALQVPEQRLLHAARAVATPPDRPITGTTFRPMKRRAV